MANTDESLLTTAARDATELRIANYLNAVAAHTGGDWAAHPTVNVYDTAYVDSNGDTTAAQTLRILSTHDTTTLALAVPIILSGSVAGSIGSAPIIIQQPVNTTVSVGGIATLTVIAISGTALTYLWEKQGTAGSWSTVAGAFASSLVLTGATTASAAGTYRCTVSNTYGATISTSASITVSAT